MGRAIYAKYADYVGPNATVTVNTGTEDATYPAANLCNRIPSLPAQLTTAAGSYVLDFGAAQRVDWVGLPHHNLDNPGFVLVQMNATNAWGGPSLSAAMTIPTFQADGFNPGAWIDLTDGWSGYTTGGYRYLRLFMDNNATPIKIGELMVISNKRILNPNVAWPVKKPIQRKIIDNMTDYGVSTIYDLGVSRRRFDGDLDIQDATAATMADWWRGTRGRARPFAFIPDESVNEAWLARFASDQLDLTQALNDRNTIPLAIEEVSRGLFL